ncbi:hypothetical protein VK70_05955 [Paenibacillus durus ATCC 35681]|uniref:Uncharacterized protein n=1 Tax=Paenibacillus durus ATCC 35681 TaxID=1333534 RepID=A0A0F7F7R4_PAEDU|nr:hypothetical protein VK70_05955 [Paenibacillus durus ATCC 35681]
MPVETLTQIVSLYKKQQYNSVRLYDAIIGLMINSVQVVVNIILNFNGFGNKIYGNLHND